jgi:hypothetical protein
VRRQGSLAYDAPARTRTTAAIDAIAPPGQHVSAFYEGDWGPHPNR